MSSQHDINGNGWSIIEDPSYEISVAQCGSFPFIDEALAPIEYALHRNPLGFERIPGFENIYLAKTKLRFIRGEIIPSLRLWVKILPEVREVHKLWVEIAPPEDMGYWDDDEKIPF